MLLKARLSVALCQWKARRPELAEQEYRSQARTTGSRLGHALKRCREVAVRGPRSPERRHSPARGGQTGRCPDGSGHEAVNLTTRFANLPMRGPEFSWAVAGWQLNLAALLRQLGEPAECIALAEETRRCHEGLYRSSPDSPWAACAWPMPGNRSASAVGARSQRGGLRRFRECVVHGRKAFEQAPSVPANRST